MERREIEFSYELDDLAKRLGLPKDSVILTIFQHEFSFGDSQTGKRTFRVKISVPTKILDESKSGSKKEGGINENVKKENSERKTRSY